jgi:hypothetical protein
MRAAGVLAIFAHRSCGFPGGPAATPLVADAGDHVRCRAAAAIQIAISEQLARR